MQLERVSFAVKNVHSWRGFICLLRTHTVGEGSFAVLINSSGNSQDISAVSLLMGCFLITRDTSQTQTNQFTLHKELKIHYSSTQKCQFSTFDSCAIQPNRKRYCVLELDD